MILLPLDGPWLFRRVGDAAWLPARVPGTNFTDLLANGRIPDPFVADHETEVQWVVQSDWEYRRTFEVDAALLACERVFLECDGLDTLATIWINEEWLSRTDNMFRPYRFDARPTLRAGANEIRVRFESPTRHAQRRRGTAPVLYPEHSLPGGPFVRKAPCHFGWDWGPRLPPCGIWRSLRLTGRRHARLGDVHLRQRHRQGGVALSVRAALERWDGEPLRLSLEVAHPDGTLQSAERRIGPQARQAALRLPIAAPRLWWPNGYGDQPLYQVRVSLSTEDGRLVDQQRRQVGLRRLQLRRRGDRFGESFTFVVNGVPLFVRGANWIPADSFPPRVSGERYRRLLQSAADVHMNMLRVWGGGFYEDERFYDLCDELGLLVWQDFMFACSVYPATDAFLENVRAEAVASLRRLRHRACLALWCGNNEMEWGWASWGWGERFPGSAREGYDRLFHRLLPQWVADEDPDTDYIPSSPTSFTPFDNPNGQERGDGHDWEVWHGRRPFTDYRRRCFRFQSEFGFQSLPALETVAAFAAPEDRNMTGWVMEHHQRCAGGNGLILHYLTQHFRMPRDFEALCYLSQILQAEAIRCGVEHWRRHRQRVSGALYWQLNDCWPAVSWSSLDYFGRWKALHYAARRFFQPALLSADEDGLKVDLHLTNDAREPFRGEVRWGLETFDGRQLAGDRFAVDAPGGSSTRVAALDFRRLLDAADRRRSVLVHELWAGENRVGEGLVAFAPDKHLELADPGLTASLKTVGGRWQATVRSRQLARFVALKLEGVDLVWSDSFFDLPAGRPRHVTCPRVRGMTVGEARERLRVRSLWDSF